MADLELSHKLVLVRSALKAVVGDSDLSYLSRTFEGMPISIYRLPTSNVFDFALMGGMSDDLVQTAIIGARHQVPQISRFDSVQYVEARRYVYHGSPLDPADPQIATIIKNIQWKLDPSALYGMLLFEFNVADPGWRKKFRTRLDRLLEEHGWQTKYCLSELRGWNNDGREPPGHGRTEFGVSPFTSCKGWLRFSADIGTNGIAGLAKLQDFHHAFRREFGDQFTTVCIPILLVHGTPEVAWPEEICRTALKVEFRGQDVAPMLWYGFDAGAKPDGALPDIDLPLGNFVVSAKSRVGKSNAVFAIVRAFAGWKGRLRLSPDYDRFDVVYLNLKSENGGHIGSSAAKEGNEARLFTGCVEKMGWRVDCVRPVHVQQHLALHSTSEKPAIIYTEPDGETRWVDLIRKISGDEKRKPRGLLLVVDEAFTTKLVGPAKDDIHNLYSLVRKEWQSRGVRLLLVGQEIRGILKAVPDASEILEKSTLILGAQASSQELVDVLQARCSAAEEWHTAEWLRCADSRAVDELAGGLELPYKVGPVVVRPSLFGVNVCHPIPCHVRPVPLEQAELDAANTVWWKVD